MSNFGKGIPLASGFDLGAKAPLDSRITVQNIQERNAHVTNNRAYKGLRVYVVDENCEYLWNGNEWLLIPSKQYVDDAIANVKISDEQLANYATKDEIPTKTSQLENDSSFATESFVTNKIAEAQLQQGEVDLNGYQTKEDTTLETTNKTIVGAINEVNTNVMSKANKSEIPTKTSQLTNDSNFLTSIPSEYVTESKLNAKGYLTSVPSEYVTESELNDKGYLTEHQDISNKADKSEIPTKTSQLTNDSGFLTEHQDISNKANKSDIPTKTSQLTNDNGFITTIPSEYITESELSTELSTKADITDIPSLEGYATETYVTNKIAEASLSGGEVDLSGYATKDELSTKANVSHTHTMSNITDLIIPDVDKAYVDTQLNTKANKSDIPNLDGYALKTDIPTVPTKTSQLTNDSNFISSIPSEYITEEELETKGYLTEHQDISGKADKSEIPTKVSDLANDSNFLTSIPLEYITESELNTKGYLTEVPSEYITEIELESKGYLTEHQSLEDYALKTEIPSVPTKTSQLTNDSNFISSIPSEYITETELNAKGFLTEIPSEYITETELTNKGYLTEHQDISGKADKLYVDTELATKSDTTHTHSYNDLSDKPVIPSINGLATKKELTDGLATKSDTTHTHDQYLTEHQDLSDYALKTELPSVPTKTSQLTNDSGYITSIPSEYITESELNAKGYLTEHQDISNKADKSEIPTKTSQLTNDSNFLTSVPSEYVTETELNAKGYLTEHQSLENYALKTELPTKTSQLTNDSNFAVQPNFTFEINMIASTEQPNVVTNGTYPNLVVTFNIPQGTSSDESGKPIYYGRLSISEVGGSVVQYNSITDTMIKSGTNITKITPQTLDRVSVGKQSETSKGDYIIVAVPNNEGYIVKKDNGLGGKIMFDKDVAGANGVILNIDGNEYAIYGEILISPAEIFIYIDKN